ALHDQLGIDTLDKLKTAAEGGEVARLRGFGGKTQQKILEGIDFLAEMGNRLRLDQALFVASSLLEGIREMPGAIRMSVCGSNRRRKETIKDIDILVSSNDPMPIMERFVSLPGVVQVTGQGSTKSSVVVQRITASGTRLTMNADLRVVSDEQYPFALH